MEGVDEASLQQVQDLNSAVTRATDQVVVGWMEGKAVDSCTVDWNHTYKSKSHTPKHINRNAHKEPLQDNGLSKWEHNYSLRHLRDICKDNSGNFKTLQTRYSALL